MTATLLLAAVSLVSAGAMDDSQLARLPRISAAGHHRMPAIRASTSPTGWERWFKTWLIDYASNEDMGFHVPGEPIDVGDIPDRAYTSQAQRALVHSLIDQYNMDYDMTPEIDRQFAALAEENIRLHPIRYYLLLPAARMLDMWFRPRSEMMPLDTHFWEIRDDPHDACAALRWRCSTLPTWLPPWPGRG